MDNFLADLQNPLTGVNNFAQLLEKIATFVGTLIGGVAVIMFIIAGILFLISAGDPAKVTKARDALKYAVMGGVVAIAAGGIVALIKQIIGA